MSVARQIDMTIVRYGVYVSPTIAPPVMKRSVEREMKLSIGTSRLLTYSHAHVWKASCSRGKRPHSSSEIEGE